MSNLLLLLVDHQYREEEAGLFVQCLHLQVLAYLKESLCLALCSVKEEIRQLNAQIEIEEKQVF